MKNVPLYGVPTMFIAELAVKDFELLIFQV
jgi:hypothetical protein